jgi:hypothetical protein
MNPNLSDDSRPPCLPELLLAYLDAAPAPAWPGGDGLTLEDALACYLNAVRAGQVPDPLQLRQRHPDLAGELDAFFAGCGPPRP